MFHQCEQMVPERCCRSKRALIPSGLQCLAGCYRSQGFPSTRLPQRPPLGSLWKTACSETSVNIIPWYQREQISGEFHQGGTTATSQPCNEPHTLSTRSGSQPWMGLFLGCSLIELEVVAAPYIYFYTLQRSLYLVANTIFVNSVNFPCSNYCVISLSCLDQIDTIQNTKKDYPHINWGLKDKQLGNKMEDIKRVETYEKMLSIISYQRDAN